MRTGFFESAVFVISIAITGGRELAVAQRVHEPTVDERFRTANDKSNEAELPSLLAPQSKVQREKPAAGKGTMAAYLGVTFAGDERAALVRTVAPGSPAEQAGLQPNDLIETLQGRRIRTNQEVLDIVAKMRPGDVLDIGFTRRMNIRTQAPLANAPAATPRSVGYPPDLPTSTLAAPEDPERQLLPAPAYGRQDGAQPMLQPNRDATPQNRNQPSAGQRRNNDQNNNRSDENRRLFGRGLRLR